MLFIAPFFAIGSVLVGQITVPKLNMEPKTMVAKIIKRNLLFQGFIFRFHIKPWEGILVVRCTLRACVFEHSPTLNDNEKIPLGLISGKQIFHEFPIGTRNFPVIRSLFWDFLASS